MNNKLSWSLKEEGQTARFILSGTITEQSDLAPLLQKEAPQIILDLEGIARINSGGVAAWVSFINKLSTPPKKVVLERCSAAIVQQLNMIYNMKGNAVIHSVMVPYVCSSCGTEHQKTVNLDNFNFQEISPSISCPSCKGNMEFDDIPEIYFSFISKS